MTWPGSAGLGGKAVSRKGWPLLCVISKQVCAGEQLAARDPTFTKGLMLARPLLYGTDMRRLFTASLLIMLTSPVFCQAQDKAALTQLLKSEQEATELIQQLAAYDAKSPWTTNVIWSLAQKLAVKGLHGKEIARTIVGSGETAAALDGNDQLFGVIALLIGGMYKATDPGPTLYALESLGVPAFDLLGEITEETPQALRLAAREERLRSAPCAALLTESCRRRYQGMSERLLLKLQQRRG